MIIPPLCKMYRHSSLTLMRFYVHNTNTNPALSQCSKVSVQRLDIENNVWAFPYFSREFSAPLSVQLLCLLLQYQTICGFLKNSSRRRRLNR